MTKKGGRRIASGSRSAAILYRLSKTRDPEERLEDAIVWKALKDRLGEAIAADDGDEAKVPSGVTHLFGHFSEVALWMRRRNLEYPPKDYDPRYWSYPTFLENAGRRVETAPCKEATALVAAMHAAGRDAFVKATVQKKLALRVPRGETLYEALDALVYEFIDGGPQLIVQEHVDMTWEYRFFVVGHEPVVGAGMVPSATPYDNTTHCSMHARVDAKMRRRPGDPVCSSGAEIERTERYLSFARRMAAGLKEDGAPSAYTLDVCEIDGRPAIVELNPSILGRVGLYACDVGRLVDATLASLGLLERADDA